MGIWPFGGEPEDVELVSRVVTAACLNQSKVRGKLTVNFEAPITQRDADAAGDTCGALTEAILAKAKAPIELLGNEGHVITRLMRQLPADLPRIRIVELASLHVIGMPAIGTRRNSTSRMQAVQMPSIASGNLSPVVVSQPGMSSSAPPAPSGRLPPTRIRAVTPNLIPARGSSPEAIGFAIEPFVRDAAARLLIGILRVHDLLVVRAVTFDQNSGDVVDALVPVSDAPPGGFEASRAAEIARWEQAIGGSALAALRSEVAVLTSFLTQRAILAAGVSQVAAVAVLQAVAGAAFPSLASPVGEIGRYAASARNLAGEVAANVARLLGRTAQAQAMETALAPVLAAVDADLGMSGMVVKSATG